MARATTGLAYGALGISVLGGLIFTMFVIMPSWSALKATRGTLVERTAARDERQRFQANVEARTAELKRYETDAVVLAVTFPENEAAADLAAVIGGLASRNGLTVAAMFGPDVRKTSSVTPPVTESAPAGTSGPARPQQVFEVKLKVRGSYASIRGFIRDLEKNVRFLDLPELEVRSGGEQQDALEANLSLLTYTVGAREERAPARRTASPSAGSQAPAE